MGNDNDIMDPGINNVDTNTLSKQQPLHVVRYAHALLIHVIQSREPEIEIRESILLPQLEDISQTETPTFSELSEYLDKLFDPPLSPDNPLRLLPVVKLADSECHIAAYFDKHS